MIISIEGNIGCGKSTVLKALAELGYTVHPEPVDKWSKWLKLFYEDPARWGMSFNTNVLLTGYSCQQHAKEELHVYERSALACKYVFSNIQFVNGNMIQEEVELFDSIMDRVVGWYPDTIIYMRTAPTKCAQRIKKRGRNAESDVSIAYITQVHEAYEAMMTSIQRMTPNPRAVKEWMKSPPKIIIVDAENDIDTVVKLVADAVKHCE